MDVAEHSKNLFMVRKSSFVLFFSARISQKKNKLQESEMLKNAFFLILCVLVFPKNVDAKT